MLQNKIGGGGVLLKRGLEILESTKPSLKSAL